MSPVRYSDYSGLYDDGYDDFVSGKSRKANEMEEPTKKQLKQLYKDITSGLVMTVTTKHYDKLQADLKRLKEENKALRNWPSKP